jgi:O-antigen/teichoic acid export membrane protein
VRFLPALAALLMTLAFSRKLPQAFYGTYQQLWVNLQVLLAIATMGIPALLITMPFEIVYSYLLSINRKVKLGITLWFLAIAIVFAIIQNRYFPEANAAVFFFLFLFNLIALIAESMLIAAKNYTFLLVSTLAYTVAYIVIHYLYLSHTISLPCLLYLLVVAALGKMAITIICAKKSCALVNTSIHTNTNHKIWLQLYLYDLLQIAFRWGDKFLLAFIIPKALFATYFNGTIEVPFLGLILGAVGSALLVNLNDSNNDSDALKLTVIKRSSGYLSSIVFPVFCFLALYYKELFAVVFQHRYDEAATLFFITTFLVPLRAYNYTIFLQHKGKVNIINQGVVLEFIVALLLAFPAYKLLGLVGIALSFVIATYFLAIYYIWYIKKISGESLSYILPLKKWLQQIALAFAAFYLAKMLLNQYSDIWQLGVGMLLLIIMIISSSSHFLYKRMR